MGSPLPSWTLLLPLLLAMLLPGAGGEPPRPAASYQATPKPTPAAGYQATPKPAPAPGYLPPALPPGHHALPGVLQRQQQRHVQQWEEAKTHRGMADVQQKAGAMFYYHAPKPSRSGPADTGVMHKLKLKFGSAMSEFKKFAKQLSSPPRGTPSSRKRQPPGQPGRAKRPPHGDGPGHRRPTGSHRRPRPPKRRRNTTITAEEEARRARERLQTGDLWLGEFLVWMFGLLYVGGVTIG
ncbi:translation initiation factor IF-2-like [Pollicipes pollicipes]|uniref:translation initiation factor IF-2-like n=1 Tax=Pollicipes pollicipes TaxID=41117 RepID=UPI0018859E1E|nr:translation initiation factor IF-2-like [Pollicipes pollicipes]